MFSDVHAIAEEEAAAGRFAGVVQVCQGEKRLLAQAYGMADRERGIPNTLSTRFRIGSIGKMFTGVSVVQLMQAGKVEPHAPLGTYLTDYPNKDVATTVSIHHLLTHAGGTGDYYVRKYLERRAEVREVADYVALLGDRGLRFEPGTQHEYSNYGFVLLGAVIEKVSGQSYHDYVDEHVFAPAGMTRSGSLPEETAVPDRAVGYTRYELEDTFDFEYRQERPNTDMLSYRGTPAGGGYSTAADLCRFANALMGHRLLDAEHTALVTTRQGSVGWEGRYASYGAWENGAIGGVTTFGHKGGAPGMSGDLSCWPRTGHVLTVLANMDPPVADVACTHYLSAAAQVLRPTPA